ncbi:unnamed protein product [Acanthoscelides obtectus]|uniref:Cupin-like domain-containing protein n=1 Tax=Acanthoscelides obtectus TaxID=200917 RepID=A0A9P0L6N4_ACAOB|nr:unnamed protein product [Acanthoscelides obtectus]CAK1652881.1 hypothetical protein AOBTE_LOCUS17952 [Acanthoscelides obtectus]
MSESKKLEIKKSLKDLNKHYLKLGFTLENLESEIAESNFKRYFIIFTVFITSVSVLYEFQCVNTAINYVLGIRCILPNNYIIWAATRPIATCDFCENLTSPLVLSNVSQEEFSKYAYTSKPILIKGTFLHWPAMHVFTLKYFQELYAKIEQQQNRSAEEGCQFLHFNSDFISLRDVLSMSKQRSLKVPKEKSWYVGWGNCDPAILQEMRKHYPKPHFLPEDSENPSTDYIFMGYDEGATLHHDFINRLMWQAQLQGSKIWHLLPPPECQEVCSKFSFLVEPGDAVLVDTRVWYHATTVNPGYLSLSIHSEYG